MNYRVSRKNTAAVLEIMEQGLVSAKAVAELCLSFMSEADVTEMLEANDIDIRDFLGE